MSPKISVFIALYNNEKYIHAAIESVIRQTAQDFEICVYDDGSTDNSAKIVREIAQKFPNKIRLFQSKKNKGAIYAYNAAMQMCTGRYLAQLDSDDVFLPTALEKLADILDKHPEIGLVCSDYEYIGTDGNFYASGVYQAELSDEELRAMMLNKTCVIYHLRMFRRMVLKQLPIWCSEPHQLCADYDLYIKMAEVTNVRKVPEVLYQQRWHETNISHQHTAQQLSARLVQLQSARRRVQRMATQVQAPERASL